MTGLLLLSRDTLELLAYWTQRALFRKSWPSADAGLNSGCRERKKVWQSFLVIWCTETQVHLQCSSKVGRIDRRCVTAHFSHDPFKSYESLIPFKTAVTHHTVSVWMQTLHRRKLTYLSGRFRLAALHFRRGSRSTSASSPQKWHQNCTATAHLYWLTLCCAAPVSSVQPGSWKKQLGTDVEKSQLHYTKLQICLKPQLDLLWVQKWRSLCLML